MLGKPRFSYDMEDYEKLLDSAYKDIKPVESRIDRFEIPKIEGHQEGSKTILTNFKQICDYLRRDCQHVLKFLLRALAASGSIKGDRVILSNKVSSKQINEKIDQYVNNFVLCKECGKPDTEIIKQDRVSSLHCLACGAKHPVKA